ncbi:MAG: site-specific integrase [Chloroflexi bacterium]|nr:site-specific integrase [Chloroflexota bacterium]
MPTDEARQLPLNLPEPTEPEPGDAREEESTLTSGSPLRAAVQPFEEYMLSRGFTENTRKAFQGDFRRLREYLGHAKPLGVINTLLLNEYLAFLRSGRSRPCSPKTYARRVTTLKVLFAWLFETGVLPRDPAAPLLQESVRAPLASPLSDAQVEEVLAAAQAQLQGEKPDPRPLVLVSLLLQTGIKKGECAAIRLADVDLASHDGPSLHIRHDSPRLQHKERRLALDRSLVPTLRRYIQQYELREHLFPWTPRNLEYILRDLATLASIEGGLSFERLRWTAALRDWRNGLEPDHLRRKLGLSQISWQEVQEKLQRLSEPPL